MIEDLQDLIPDVKKIKLNDRKTGKTYKVDLFVPAIVGLLFVNEEVAISNLLQGKIDKEQIKLIWKMFEIMFMPQNEFMNAEWCENNIDLQTTILIVTQIGKPLYDYLKFTGIIPEAKRVIPEADQEQQLDLHQ